MKSNIFQINSIYKSLVNDAGGIPATRRLSYYVPFVVRDRPQLPAPASPPSWPAAVSAPPSPSQTAAAAALACKRSNKNDITMLYSWKGKLGNR